MVIRIFKFWNCSDIFSRNDKDSWFLIVRKRNKTIGEKVTWNLLAIHEFLVADKIFKFLFQSFLKNQQLWKKRKRSRIRVKPLIIYEFLATGKIIET